MNPTARTHTGTICLKSYIVGLEDREPPLIRELTPRRDPVYPYTTQELITDESYEREYEAIFLENKYLKLTFLPELNGRLYSAYDKINNNELFYANKSIKPALFALRGAWPAVGVEFNFPNSHTTTTMERAFTKIQEAPDGSASVIVGDIECTSRMSWRVETKLRPDSMSIEMISTLRNPTDFPQRYYYWINAACPVFPETEFIYPPSTQRLLTHPPMDASLLGYVDWPRYKGVDMRFFKNVKQHLPLFAETMEEDFYGIYHHDKGYGLAHVADHSLVKGRKLWMFGTARDGRVFIDQLSDERADYCELQTGPFPLQSDYRLLQPGGTYVQRDCWLPVSGTKGFNLACRKFAAKVIPGNSGELRLCATEKLEKIGIFIGDEKISSFDADPGKPITLTLPCEEESVISFREETGETLAVRYPKAKRVLCCPPSSTSEPSGYLKGKYFEEQGFNSKAENYYKASASKEWESALAAARLEMGRGLWKDAESQLERILSTDANNAEALIYHGLILMQKNDCEKAEVQFAKAADDNVYRKRSLVNIAKCAIKRKEYRRALEILDENDDLMIFCRRKLGLTIDKKSFKEITPILVGEEYFKTGNCIYAEHIAMESVCEYIQLGEYSDAKFLLENTISEKSAYHYYYLAWLSSMLDSNEEMEKNLGLAKKEPWHKMFAFRRETECVLKWVLNIAPEDMLARYQLASLFAFNERWEESAKLWKTVPNGECFADSQRNLGLYHWKVKNNLDEARNHYLQALKEKPGAKAILEAFSVFDELEDTEAQINVFKGQELLIQNDCRVKLYYIKALLANQRPEEAAELFTSGKFKLCEGKKTARELYVNTYRELAKKAESEKDFTKAAEYYLAATEYPENIGIGKPSSNQNAELFYEAGKSYAKANCEEKAKECFSAGKDLGDFIDIDFFPLKRIVPEADEPIEFNDPNPIFRNLCSKELNSN